MGRKALATSRKRMIREWQRRQRWWGARVWQGWDVPHSHGRLKGLRSTKDGPGKAQPQFPHCHEGTGSDKARLRSCTDLSSERVRDRHPWWETQRGPAVTPPGASWHPEHLQGVGDTPEWGSQGKRGPTGGCEPGTGGSMEERTTGMGTKR